MHNSILMIKRRRKVETAGVNNTDWNGRFNNLMIQENY